MAQALDDPSIIPAVPELLFDEDDTYDTDVDNMDSGITQSDVESILAHLKSI